MDLGWTKKLWILPPLLILLGFAALAVDLPVTAWFRAGKCPSELYKFVRLSEVVAEGHGVGMILLLIWVLDVARRRSLPRLVAASFGAGLLADAVKLFIARARPNYFFNELHGSNIFDSFRWQWSGLNSESSRWQSFPSAHVATGVGLAIILAWRYPRGRWLFFTFMVLAATQRVADSYHFLSDVCWASALGASMAWLCIRGPLGPVFDRFEAGNPLRQREPYAPAAEVHPLS
ncbi:MAG TPA: phosphatase PAP2 family protein [Pirellulales bacterium]|jgi:membrane-associated phospholipid phosphatase|nr:phosphatase PAP2 family protein [Pirellulales bacterium]